MCAPGRRNYPVASCRWRSTSLRSRRAVPLDRRPRRDGRAGMVDRPESRALRSPV